MIAEGTVVDDDVQSFPLSKRQISKNQQIKSKKEEEMNIKFCC
jgi:hypothetical protein